MGVRVAHNLISGNIVDYVELVPGYSIVEVLARGSLVHKTLRELDLRARYGISVMAIKRGNDIIVAPGANDAVEPGDKLVAIGQDEMLDRLQHMNEDDQ